jgi:hypothetical protein
MEAGLPDRCLDLHLDPVDVGSGRAVVTPLHDPVDGRLGTFEHRLDPPVSAVADPPGDADPRDDGLLAQRLPEPHALHAPADEDPLADSILAQTWHASQ